MSLLHIRLISPKQCLNGAQDELVDHALLRAIRLSFDDPARVRPVDSLPGKSNGGYLNEMSRKLAPGWRQNGTFGILIFLLSEVTS